MATKHALDFTNVKEGGGINPVRMPEGDYRAKLIKVLDEEVKSGDNKGKPMWNFIFQLEERASATYPYRCTLVENQLWKVRNLLIAAGKSVPKKRVNVDPNTLVGTVMGITLTDDEYEGKPKSVIDAIFPASELADDEEVNAAPAAEDITEDEDADLDLDDL